MKILVTGATGYIGSHVCKILKENNHYVVGWDINMHSSYNLIDQWCDEFYEYNILDPHPGEFDAIVHLAARNSVPLSVKRPSIYYKENILGTLTLIESTMTPHFIFASTSSAGEMASPYARSKVACEDIIKEKCNGYTIFRFFNVSGTDGVNHQVNNEVFTLIRAAAKVAAGKKESLDIYGTDYPTRDGTCIRDYLHVLDLCDSIIPLLAHGPANTDYEELGSVAGYSVFDVVNAMEQVINKPLKTNILPRRKGDAVSSIVTKPSKFLNVNKTLLDMCKDQYNFELKHN